MNGWNQKKTYKKYILMMLIWWLPWLLKEKYYKLTAHYNIFLASDYWATFLTNLTNTRTDFFSKSFNTKSSDCVTLLLLVFMNRSLFFSVNISETETITEIDIVAGHDPEAETENTPAGTKGKRHCECTLTFIWTACFPANYYYSWFSKISDTRALEESGNRLVLFYFQLFIISFTHTKRFLLISAANMTLLILIWPSGYYFVMELLRLCLTRKRAATKIVVYYIITSANWIVWYHIFFKNRLCGVDTRSYMYIRARM